MRPSDSLSKCDTHLYSNPYQVGNHPELKASSTTRSMPRDSIEGAKEALHKEALSRLKHTSKYVVMQQGIIRVGKYLFLTAALPPYLLLYRIPKWILVEMMPIVMTFFGQMGNKIKLPIQKRIDAVIQKFTHFMQKAQEVIHGLIQPVINVLLEIRNVVYQINRRALQFMNRLFKREKKEKTGFSFSLNEVFRRAQEGVLKGIRWITQQGAALFTPIQIGLAWIKQSSHVLSFNRQSFTSLKKGMQTILGPLSSTYQASQKIVTAMTNWAARQFSWCGEKVGQVFRQTTKWIPPLWHKTRSVFNQVREFLERHRQRFWGYVKELQAKLKALTARQVLHTLSAKLKWLPGPLQRFFNRLIHHPIIETLLHFFLKGFSFVFSCLTNGVSWIGQGISKGWSFLFNLIQLIKQMAAPTAKFVSQKGLFGWGYLTRTCYHLVVWIVMLGILFSWGIKAGAKTSTQFLSLMGSKK